MFELGWVEIGIIGVIALVVLGPERLPKAARFAGLWVRKARAQWFAVKAEMERELAAEELKASLQAERDAIRDAVQQIDDEARALRDGLAPDAPAATAPAAGALPPADAAPDPSPEAPRPPAP
jgi:sec-independent protein translocase protein TatB